MGENTKDWVSDVLQHGLYVLLPKQRTDTAQEKESESKIILRRMRTRRTAQSNAAPQEGK